MKNEEFNIRTFNIAQRATIQHSTFNTQHSTLRNAQPFHTQHSTFHTQHSTFMKKLYAHVLDYFRQLHPEVTTELEFGSVFQLLVAVVLSAQCTDKRVNQVTPELFRRYPDAHAMSQADETEVYEYVKSVSYPNAKARLGWRSA